MDGEDHANKKFFFNNLIASFERFWSFLINKTAVWTMKHLHQMYLTGWLHFYLTNIYLWCLKTPKYTYSYSIYTTCSIIWLNKFLNHRVNKWMLIWTMWTMPRMPSTYSHRSQKYFPLVKMDTMDYSEAISAKECDYSVNCDYLDE